jgi:RNA polymerase sigma-70 factor (ECF subfamily)
MQAGTETLLEPRAAPLRAPDDDGRLREMVTLHFDFVWRTIVRLGVPRAEAEDAAQQVFIVASRKLSSIAVGSEKSYLFQTARRLAWNARRTIRRRREDAEPAQEHLDPSATPDSVLERSRMRAAMDRIIEEMELDLREIFVLFELEELTMVEIARMLGLPAGTVASRLRRARAAFRESAQRMAARSEVAR